MGVCSFVHASRHRHGFLSNAIFYSYLVLAGVCFVRVCSFVHASRHRHGFLSNAIFYSYLVLAGVCLVRVCSFVLEIRQIAVTSSVQMVRSRARL